MAGTAIIGSMLCGFVSCRRSVSLVLFDGPIERKSLSALDELPGERCSTSDLERSPNLRDIFHVEQALYTKVKAARRTAARSARPIRICGTGVDAGDFLAGPSRLRVDDGAGLPFVFKFKTCDAEAGGKTQGELRPNSSSAVRPVLDGTRLLA